MAPPFDLLGPPFLYRHFPYADAASNYICAPADHDLSSTLLPEENPCLDLFFSQTLLQNLLSLLPKAWIHSPTATLKLIFSLQNVVSTSKESNKEAFFTALLWLYQHHPLTLACNVNVFESFGCMKDLLEILRRILEGPTKKDENECVHNKKQGKAKARALKREEDIAMAKNAAEKYAKDANYRFLHNQIARVFAELLEADLEFLASGEIDKISLASKWCPTLDSSHDKCTLICEGIARMLFPQESHEYKQIDEAHYAYRIRDRLRKEVLVPLRKALGDAKQVNSIAFVKSQKSFLKKDGKKFFSFYQENYRKLFTKDDDERFRAYLKIANSCRHKDLPLLSPHVIIASLNDGHVGNELAALKWQSLVEHYTKRDRWRNCLAIYNVSENMKGPAKDFSIGMSLLLSELCQEPWKGKMVTFSTDPKLCRIEGGDLRSKVKYMKQLKYEKNIRFSKVFDQISQCAVAKGVREDNMTSKIFVFTDMGFEQAANNFWGVWANITKYNSHGYKTMPQVVFWDIRGSVGIPNATKHEQWVMIKGFSTTWANIWLDRGAVPTLEEVMNMVQKPEDVMQSAISRKELQNLVVFD